MNNIKNILPTLLLIGSVFGLSSCKLTTDTPLNQEHFLIGTYTQEFSQGIYKISLDTNNDLLFNHGVIAKGVNPSYLALSKNKNWLYAATGKKTGGIDIFLKDSQSNTYNLQQQLINIGKDTCHISLNPQENQLAIANYSSSDIYVFSIDPLTKKLTQKSRFKNFGSGPTSRQKESHMHYVQWDSAGRFLYAVDLGTDEVLAFDSTSDNFTPLVAAKLSAGDGPRHLAFHPIKPWVYVLNELTNSVTVFDQDIVTGKLTFKQNVSALLQRSKQKQSPNNTSSAIKISNDGKFIYAGVRGINEIAVFAINTNGTTTLIQSHSTLGNWPRDITLSSSQQHLLIANQKSSTITVLKRNNETGLLSNTDMTLDISTPSYIGVFK